MDQVGYAFEILLRLFLPGALTSIATSVLLGLPAFVLMKRMILDPIRLLSGATTTIARGERQRQEEARKRLEGNPEGQRL